MRVILDIFSGRQNPSWHLDEQRTRELVERVKSFSPYSAEFSLRSQLGPRRVILELARNESHRYALPAQFIFPVDDAKGGIERRTVVDPLKRETMDWLVDTSKSALDDHTKDAIRSVMRRDEMFESVQTDTIKSAGALEQTTILASQMGEDVCQPFLSPMWLYYWNNPLVRPTNNCYNYASNVATYTLAQPGRFAGQMYTSFDCTAVRDAAFADGVKPDCNGLSRVIALAIWPGIDFHWWRLHPNGFWAHKVGWNSATNLDNRGRIIGNSLSPENCDRGPYSLFCGYYFAPLGMRVL